MSSFSELYKKYAIPMDGLAIATEADDVTQEVARQMGGSRAPTNQSTDERTEDLTQTDNIFGDAHEGDEDAPPPQNPTPDDPETTDEDDPIEDEAQDAPEDAGADDTDPAPEEGEESPEGDDSIPEAPESVYSDKNTLKENIIYFLNTLRSDLDELTNSLGNLNDLDSIQVVNSVMTSLRNCKDILHKVLTDEMESSSYEELMRKYITIKRIYDISIEMLDKHFSNAQKKPTRRKPTRTKIRE